MPGIKAGERAVDILSLSKVIEKGVFEILMWILFFPLTLFRMIFRPRTTLAYVRQEVAKADLEDGDDDASFESAVRPALFLFLAVVIAAVLVPLTPEEIAEYQQTDLGKALLGSWISLVAYNTVIFSIMPLTGAVLLDLLTPGRMTRRTLRLPFDQQCYIGAPSMFGLMALVSLFSSLSVSSVTWCFLILGGWLLVVEYMFFRDNSTMRRRTCVALALTTVVVGLILILIATAMTTGLGIGDVQTAVD